MAGFGVDRGGGASSGVSESGLTETIDAKGDLLVGTADNVADRLAVGTNEQRLVADSTQATGLKYVADTTNYAIAAKGDILAGTAADTVAPLTVGANGTILMARSAATPGLAYVAALAGRIQGLDCSNAAGDLTNDIVVAEGSCISSDGAEWMVLSAALTKRIDASWVVGDTQGGLDGTESVTGTPDNDTWYYVWLIKRSDTGVVDVLFSESSSAPTMPTNYDFKRLIGAVRRGTAANLLFYQDGDWITYQAGQSILSGGTATSETSVTTTGFVPSIARRMLLEVTTAFTYGNVIDAQNFTTLRVVTGVNAWNQGGYQTGNTGTFSERNQVEIPVTGTLLYLQAPATTTSASSSLSVRGFKLAR